MMKRTNFYSLDGVNELKKRNHIWQILLGVIAVLSLIFCVSRVILATTLTVGEMEKQAIIAAVVSGWVIIALYINVLLPGRREVTHAMNMIESEPEVRRGRLTLTKDLVQIRGSILIRKVILENENEKVRLNLNESRKKYLKDLTGEVTVYTVGNYIVGFEEEA